MIRAGVFVGVDKAGNLQRLKDAAAGARRMYEWALKQGMVATAQAKLITDADGGKVTPDTIYNAIKGILDGPGIDQLVLYFAGHGVNINRGEHWLLTDAPVRTSAAVNVSGSVELARYSGAGHIVVISDACRVAPEGIQAQNVRGVDVFPNEGASARAKPVDQFFACLLGRTAAEISDPVLAAGNFCALYTDVLLDALTGKRPEILEPSDVANDTAYYVKPVKLESYLETEVPVRVRSLNLQKKVNQNPDAILTAHLNWVSKIEKLPQVMRGTRMPATRSSETPPQDLAAATRRLISTAVGRPKELCSELSELEGGMVRGAKGLAGTFKRVAAPFGPDHFESQCGIKVQGTRITGFTVPQGSANQLSNELVRINLNHGAMSVILRFEDHLGTVIPVVAGFVTAVSFRDGELIDVAYEPSANTWRWSEFTSKADEIRALRAIAASASQHGRFRLDKADAHSIAQKMQFAKGIDPTLAVYAAYAYHDLQETDRIDEMSHYLRDDIGITFFDLALLSRNLVEKRVDRNSAVVPFVPLLSQGWHLLRANRVRLHPALDGLARILRESVWCLYDSAGLDLLERALLSGDVL